ncbi:uncharacterized protein BT62DRAFT_737843 [Guyanagaster necrorhizus]|uniref:Uncharacterized protein n=1 Tax=Guyanagaster necrorhizus TaxID=856835 RepID=A0A9P7VEU0_9AGAR|nr:uncharacterized protein BT62DRAFT_737843 [Guyanagaster necrorhizus MCA 3950]KAG7439404.1 hypothetical protein BT62DRAFT_737843 [Guyanagaster necrorhizus MCA 3950]
MWDICIQHNSTFSETQSWSVLLGSMALLLDMINDSSRAKESQESVKYAALVIRGAHSVQLLRTLKTDTSGVDRQGAGQGLSEVLSGLGMEHLEGLLPDIIANAQSPTATVREGFMSLLAMTAGRMIITNYSNRAIDLFDPGWRIRQSLCSKFPASREKLVILMKKTSSMRALQRALAALYLVRQSSIQIWKAL